MLLMLKLCKWLRPEMAAVRGMTSSVARYASAERNLRCATNTRARPTGRCQDSMLLMLKLRRRLRPENAAVTGMTSFIARYSFAELNLWSATIVRAVHKGRAHRQLLRQ
jgi:hypothetical protein